VSATCRAVAALAAAAILSACVQQPPAGPYLHGPIVDDPHVPPFANAGWAPFSRAAAIAIAQREWRLFGSKVDDDPPGTRGPLPPPEKPERAQGLWQRVGEYWWEGLPPDAELTSASGIHDAHGRPIADDTLTPWSAAFISYVMRLAGAASRFPYSASHSTYINAAAAGTNPILRAHSVETYTPQAGELICHGRGQDGALRFSDLPTDRPFASHCDLVVDATPTQLTVIGGNVDDAVSAKHVPVSSAGRLADPNYTWSVILEVLYDLDTDGNK
jgi:hypothetical protein